MSARPEVASAVPVRPDRRAARRQQTNLDLRPLGV